MKIQILVFWEFENLQMRPLSGNTVSGNTTPTTNNTTHLIPNVIITSLPSPPPPEQEIKDRIYRQNSKRAYSELSKKLGERLKQEQQQNQKQQQKDDKETKVRHNWKNKEVKVKNNNTTK